MAIFCILEDVAVSTSRNGMLFSAFNDSPIATGGGDDQNRTIDCYRMPTLVAQLKHR